MQEVKVDLNLKTVEDESERQVAAIQSAQLLKAETSQCAKAIHAMGGEECVWDTIGSGVLPTAFAESLGVSYAAFKRWVARGGEARQSAYTRARQEGADTLAESTVAIADAVEHAESNTAVQAAKLRSDTRWRLAAARNPEQYGNRPADININLGDITLDALRKRRVRPDDVIDVDAD